MQDVYVCAVGLIPFGKYPDEGVKDLTAMAMTNLLNHSPVKHEEIEAARRVRTVPVVSASEVSRFEEGQLSLPRAASPT